jgi:hypothetical protein
MGQVIQLAFPSTDYPPTKHALGSAESVFLIAVRWWVADYRQGEDPLPRLCEAMRAAGAHDAAFSVDQLMAIVARSARQQIAIHCPDCPHLSADEKHLLHAASLAQASRSDLAERALRTALLSAQGAEFALGPLEGLSKLFTEARLHFCRRRAPAADRPGAHAVEAWMPSIH